MKREDDLRRKIGQLFVWGFEGTRLTKSFKKFFRRYPPAGVILFKRNLESPRQIRNLTKDLQVLGRGMARHAPTASFFIGIDQEGGRVSRLPPPFAQLPPAAIWGKIYEREKDPKAIFRAGHYLARELLSVGINTDFAPVLDVNSNPKNPIIGDRAFSDDPKIAAHAAVAFYLGLKKGGVIACGKHFPGHGDTRSDSHLMLPHLKKSREGLEKVELYPFREAIKKKIPMLMTAHVVYESLDRKNPATLSSLILNDLLRRRMKFEGVIISDDLQMKAISNRFSVVEASILALQAGVDLLLACRGGERGESVIEEVSKAVASDLGLKRRVDESFQRILRLKKRYLK